MADIDELSIKISASTGRAVNNINKLVSALTSLNQELAKVDSSRLNAVANSANALGTAVTNIRSSGRTISAIANNLSQIGQQAGSIKQTTTATQQLAQASQQTAQATSNAVGSITQTTNAANGLSQAAAQTSQAMGQVAQSAGNASNATKNSTKATQGNNTALRQASQVLGALKSGWSGFTGVLKTAGGYFKNVAKNALKAATHLKGFSKASNHSKKSMSGLVKELTRIGKMLKLMVTRMVLRKIIEGIGDGFKNLAQYSKTFDSTLSLLWNDFRQLGGSIAAAASPLLNAFAPAIHYIIQLVIQAVNAINQLLSALTGFSRWTKAKTLTDSYAKSLDKAGASAKELKKTVLGFDELNQLQDNKNNGGGGTDPANMFEELPIEDKWKEWAAKLKKMWEQGDFTELGQAIGEWLKNALDSIPWSKVYATAAKIGKSLATLINGFIEVPELGQSIGRTLANAFNTAFYFLDSFVKSLHWKSVGQFIADTFNGFFENINWNKIKDTVYHGMLGIATAIQTFINDFHWDNISKTLTNALGVITTGVRTFFENIDWHDLGSRMGDQLAKTIKGTNWREVGRAIGDVIQAAIDWVSGFIDRLKVDDVVKALSDMLAGFFEKVNMTQAGENLGKLLKKLVDIIVNFWKENKPEILQAVKDFFKGMFSEVKASDLIPIIRPILYLALLNAIKNIAVYGLKIAFGNVIKSALTGGAATATATAGASAAGASIGTLLLAGVSATFTAAAFAEVIGLAIGDVKNYKEALGVDNLWDALFDRSDEMNEKRREYADSKSSNPYNGNRNKAVYNLREKVKELKEEMIETRGEIYKTTDAVVGSGRSFDDLAIHISNSTDTMKASIGGASKSFDDLATNAGTTTSSFSKAVIDAKDTVNESLEGMNNDFANTDSNMSAFGQHFGDTFDTASSRLNRATGRIGSDLNIVDINFKRAVDNVNTNSQTLTVDIPKKMEGASSEMSSTVANLSASIDKEMSKGFKNVDEYSKSFTKDMPSDVEDATEEINASIVVLSGNMVDNMAGISSTVEENTSKIDDSFKVIQEGMSEDKWTFSGVKDGLAKTFEAAKEAIEPIWNSIVDKLNGSHKVGTSTMDIHLPRMFAAGGFPRRGEMFIAREAGAEMVGSINGRTAVANNQQITEGIARAVYSAMTAASSQMNNGGGQYINNTIMVDGVAIARAVTKGQNSINRRYSPNVITG